MSGVLATGISAIMPVHDGAAHLAAGLRSILAQSCPVQEIIVVDDGSTDGSAEIARNVAPLARIVTQRQAGPASARNAGASAAQGEFLAFLDHDDLWPGDRNAQLLAAAAAQPGADLISGRIEISVEPGAVADALLSRANRIHVPFLFSTGLIRRRVWHCLGGMAPAQDYAEDVDLYLRLLDAGVRVALTDAVTLIYRQHSSNRSRAIERTQAALLDCLHGTLRRRRARSTPA